jgi:hypothetical protein
MQTDKFMTKSSKASLVAVLLMLCGGAGTPSVAAEKDKTDKQAYRLEGVFVEGCKCGIPCACELTGVEMGCSGVGAMSLTGGKFQGVDLSGVKLAYGGTPGEWVRLYVDAPKANQRDAALSFAKGYYKKWGKIEAAKDARIDIAGHDGNYTVTVDNGKIMELKTEPVLGGDQKTPIKISNTKSELNPVFLQGRTVSGKFEDDNRSFKLKDSNSYFNKLNAKGEL